MPAALRLIETFQAMPEAQRMVLPARLEYHLGHFWAVWDCVQCGWGRASEADLFAISDLVYWSHERTRQFMQHPRWISEPEVLIEYAGQSAIRFQMTNLTSNERLTLRCHPELCVKVSGK